MTAEVDLGAVADRFSLGAIDGPAAERHGGVNRLWRMRTTRGEFAVHALLGLADDPRAGDRCQQVHDLEVAAAAAGVRVAPPIAVPDSGRACALLPGFGGPVIVHRWVDADPVEVDGTTPAFYGRLGRSLARVHAIGADPGSVVGDALERRPTAEEWRAVAAEAQRAGWHWAPAIGRAADELADAVATADGWDLASGEPLVAGHRDLTSQNVLDDAGEPVLIDWEDAGPIAAGVEIGRTALDNLSRGSHLDDARLRAFLAGYHEVRRLPPTGRHWCGLWVRGLVVYADHCARSCLSPATPPGLREQQAQVLDIVVGELRRRLDLVDSLVEAFDRARPAT